MENYMGHEPIFILDMAIKKNETNINHMKGTKYI